MLLAGIDWKTLPPARLINVLSVLITRHAMRGEEYITAWDKVQRAVFDPPEYVAELVAEEYEASLDENGLPKGLLEMPKG